eukprot:scaffold239764_cov21-Tisochrysis_lutea.AAC.1
MGPPAGLVLKARERERENVATKHECAALPLPPLPAANANAFVRRVAPCTPLSLPSLTITMG